MKRNKYASLAILMMAGIFSLPLRAHSAGTPDTLPPKFFPKVEKDASFEEGIEGWTRFLVANVRGDVALKKGAPAGRHQAYVRFLIDTTGRIDTVLVVKDPGYGMAEELKRVILLSSGKWQPAILEGGKKKASMRGQPFTFQVNQK